MICKLLIKAILFNVDEKVFDNLVFGNDYIIQKDRLSNKKLYKEFDYTDIGIRRVYESAKINNDLEIAVLYKTKDYEIDNIEDISKEIDKHVNSELSYIDDKVRTIRLFSNNTFNIREVLYVISYSPCEGNTITRRGRIPTPDRIINNYSLKLETKEKWKILNNLINSYDIHYLDSNFDQKTLEIATFDYDLTYTANIDTLRFMSGIIGLECLFSDKKNKSSIAYKLARNCALLLSKNKEEYDYIKNDIKTLYNKRSKYVHNGIIDDLTEKDIVLVREYLRKIIFIINNKNISKDALLEKLDYCGIDKFIL